MNNAAVVPRPLTFALLRLLGDGEFHSGEVLGIAGVQGNGQTELVEALTGLRGVHGGQVLMDDQELDSRRSTGAIYWEGAVRLLEGGREIGQGYLEMTGY